MTQGQLIGIIAMSVIFVLLLILAYCSNNYSLNGIKSKKSAMVSMVLLVLPQKQR